MVESITKDEWRRRIKEQLGGQEGKKVVELEIKGGKRHRKRSARSRCMH